MALNTRLLMTLSAALLALLGVGITFLPQELLAHVGAPPTSALVLLAQLLGALYLGFAILNWLARANLVGGIYGRPVSMANFFHFAVGAVALLKDFFAHPAAVGLAVLAALYCAFAIWFGLVLFTHPARATTKD